MGVIRARAEYLLHSELGAWKQQEVSEIIIKQIDRISPRIDPQNATRLRPQPGVDTSGVHDLPRAIVVTARAEPGWKPKC